MEGVVSGTRFPLDPLQWIEGIELSAHTHVHKKNAAGAPEQPLVIESCLGKYYAERQDMTYQCTGPDLLLPAQYRPLQEWLANLKICEWWQLSLSGRQA